MSGGSAWSMRLLKNSSDLTIGTSAVPPHSGGAPTTAFVPQVPTPQLLPQGRRVFAETHGPRPHGSAVM